jgi:inorganic pyrophosphatase
MTNNFEVYAIVEIPCGSMYKYEVNKESGQLTVDRHLPHPLPYNYGYIPNTLHEDGDPLDVCIIGCYPIYPLAVVKVVLLGAFKCIDNGVSDDKILAVVSGENWSDEEIMIEKVKHYLSTYKEGFVVGDRVSAEEAYAILMKDLDAHFHG